MSRIFHSTFHAYFKDLAGHYAPSSDLFSICSKDHHLLILRLKLHVHTLPHEEYVSKIQLVRLAAHRHRPLPTRHDHDTRPLHRLDRLLRPGVHLRDQHVEFRHGRRVDPRRAALAPVERLHLDPRLVGAVRREGERLREELDTVAVSARAEARVEHVVGPCHALDDVALEPGVNAVGGYVDGLARLQDEIVHADQRDEGAVVGGRVVFLQTGEESQDVFAVGAVGVLGEFEHRGLAVANGGFGGVQHAGADMFQGFVIEVRLGGGNELLEGFKLKEVLDFGKRLEADKELEGGEGDSDLGFVVCVAKLLWIFLMKASSEIFVWVNLEGEGFRHGKDLEAGNQYF